MNALHALLCGVLLLLSGCVATPERISARDVALAGDWVFEVPTGNAVVHGAMTLASEGGAYTGTLTTDQGAAVMPVRTVTLRDDALRLEVESPNGDVVFVGTMDAAQQRFEGEVTYHNGQRFPMRGWRRGLR
jgi:hypothetical protein